MKYRHLLSVIGIAAALSWGTAHADMLSGGTFYVGGEAGWTNLEDQPVSVGVPGLGITSGTAKFEDGYNAGGRVGMMWGPWRLEEEFTYRHNEISSIAGVGTSGSVRSVGFMTNLIYDFQLNWPVTQHVGGGIGAVNIEVSNPVIKSNSWEFGYQGIAGIRYNINPSLAFDLDYRYLATTDPTFHTNAATGLVPVKTEYSTHNILASLTFLFNAPPPPPPVIAPAAAPAPPPPERKVFLVFFDWDRDTITPEGMQIIQQAAAAFRSGAPVRIMVTGYTDRSGSPGYNQRLSERRANNVANALARLGVPRDQMAVSGRGENDNRVPTADGVREPQNRRVEIVFP